MSSYSEEIITCPECGQATDFKVWKSINTMLDPEMKEKVRTREAFSFCCPECGKNVNVDYGFLYHQMEDEMMICYASNVEDFEKTYEMFSENGTLNKGLKKLQGNYLYRIVTSQNELREKLFIFDAGLDDRVIEIVKTFYAAKYINEHPEKNLEELFFRPEKMELVFYIEGKPVATADVSKEFYDLIEKEYVAGRPALREDDFIINLEWGLDRMREREEEEGSQS